MNKSLLFGLAVVGYCPIVHMALSLSCPLLWLYVPLAIVGFCGFMLCIIELLRYRFRHGQEDWHEMSVPYTPTALGTRQQILCTNVEHERVHEFVAVEHPVPHPLCLSETAAHSKDP